MTNPTPNEANRIMSNFAVNALIVIMGCVAITYLV